MESVDGVGSYRNEKQKSSQDTDSQRSFIVFTNSYFLFRFRFRAFRRHVFIDLRLCAFNLAEKFCSNIQLVHEGVLEAVVGVFFVDVF